MKKPSKAWQFGLDFIVDEQDNIYFIEINNNSYAVLDKTNILKNISYDENINGINNHEMEAIRQANRVSDYLDKFNIKEFSYKHMYNLPSALRISREVFKKRGINLTYGNNIYTIYCGSDSETNQNNDWFSCNKTILTENINLFKSAGIKPISNTINYNINTIHPTFVVKPINGSNGNGVVFYKQKEIIIKENNITQEYIFAKPSTESYNWVNSTLVKKIHQPRLCDYRLKLIIDDLGNTQLITCHRRTSSINLPDKLSDDVIDFNHPHYNAFLCNASKNAYRTIIPEDKLTKWEILSRNVGKIIFDNFINKKND